MWPGVAETRTRIDSPTAMTSPSRTADPVEDHRVVGVDVVCGTGRAGESVAAGDVVVVDVRLEDVRDASRPRRRRGRGRGRCRVAGRPRTRPGRRGPGSCGRPALACRWAGCVAQVDSFTGWIQRVESRGGAPAPDDRVAGARPGPGAAGDRPGVDAGLGAGGRRRPGCGCRWRRSRRPAPRAAARPCATRSWLSGTSPAPGTCPLTYSYGSRTSITTAPSRCAARNAARSTSRIQTSSSIPPRVCLTDPR